MSVAASTHPARARPAVIGLAMAGFVGAFVPWVFPSQVASVVGTWVLPTFSILSLAVAVSLAAEWPWLRACLLVLATTLIVGWMKVPGSVSGSAHFAGASVGLLTMLLIGTMADTPGRLRLVVVVFLVGGLAVLALGLVSLNPLRYQTFSFDLSTKLPDLRLRLAGLEDGFVNPNALAAAALLIGPLGGCVLLIRKPARLDRLLIQPLGAVTFTAALVILALSKSRTGALAVWLTLIAVLAHGIANRWWRVAVGLAVAAVPVAATISVFFTPKDVFLWRASEMWHSVLVRAHAMITGTTHWREAPWFGIGLNEFRKVYRPLPGNEGIDIAHAHNMYLQTALDVGAIGLAAYCGVLICLFAIGSRARVGSSPLAVAIAIGSMLAWAAVSFFGLADAVTLGAKVGMFQWIAAGLILAAARIQGTITSV